MKYISLSFAFIGIILFFNIAGITTPATGFAYQFLDGGVASFKNTSYWTAFVFILTVAISATAIAGLFGRAPPESYIIGSLVFTFTAAIMTDMIGIFIILYETGEPWIRAIATLVFAPLTFVYVSSAISYWRGSEN